MDESELKNEILDLTLACQRDGATAQQWARLELLMEDEPEAIKWYLRTVNDTLTLRSAAAASAASADEKEQSGFSSNEIVVVCRSKLRRPSIGTISKAGGWLAAACLLVAFSTASQWQSLWSKASPPSIEGIAQVVSTSNVQWSDGAKRFTEWTVVEPGDVLRFEAGLLSLFLSNGAEILIEGPADVTYESLQKVCARQGKLAARVGPKAVGLRIETPHANVIDRGTAFGLSVDANCRTSVVVYEGIVDLDVLGGVSQPRRRLATGEGLSVNKRGELSRVTAVQGADFLEPPQARVAASDQGRVITSVSDNVRSLETAKYYRVIPQGFREDCRAYVDRNHEWNGLDDRGLPPFLAGGDYVMTFNDDKVTTEIEIAVTVNGPATLYVLIDDRVAPPDWLKRDFVDTKWDIGSDDGWDEGDIVTGRGAGQSIDHVCSVWRRDVLEPSTVVLGALSHEELALPAIVVERSMYGIVATSLHRER
jgi:hypothetical protein